MTRLHPAAILFLLLLNACALSPQTVVIDPELSVVTQGTGEKDIRLSLEVVDPRTTDVIGQRGGVYKTTSDIRTDPGMTTTLRKKLATAFGNLGYQVVTPDEAARARLLVEIAELTYVAHQEELIDTIETRVVIRTTCWKGSGQYGSTYRVTHKKEVIKAPSEEKNEELVNNVIARALDKMLSDGELIAFIDG